MEPSPTRISQADLEIRNKALNLLHRMGSETDLTTAYEEEEKKKKSSQKIRSNNSSNNNQQQYRQYSSYQQSATSTSATDSDNLLERERQEFRRSSPSSFSSSTGIDESWVGPLLPIVSCVSEACKVGLTGIANQTVAGVRIVKDEVEERLFSSSSSGSGSGRGSSSGGGGGGAFSSLDSIKGTFESVGISGSYYQSKYSDIPDNNNTSVGASGQNTSEEWVHSV